MLLNFVPFQLRYSASQNMSFQSNDPARSYNANDPARPRNANDPARSYNATDPAGSHNAIDEAGCTTDMSLFHSKSKTPDTDQGPKPEEPKINAESGGQSALSSDSNKLVLCSPLRVAQHIAVTMRQMELQALQLARSQDAWECGGGDWPNAYRHSPMSFQESLGCVVVLWHEQWDSPAYQIYTGLLFGLPLAVTSFNRYRRFVEWMRRRLTYLLVSLYFDDACISDWSSSKGSGQLAQCFIRRPICYGKAAAYVASEGLFLGLDHDVSQALSDNKVAFGLKRGLRQSYVISSTRAGNPTVSQVV